MRPPPSFLALAPAALVTEATQRQPPILTQEVAFRENDAQLCASVTNHRPKRRSSYATRWAALRSSDAAGPWAIRAASPATSRGNRVRQGGSGRPPATTRPSRLGPPS